MFRCSPFCVRVVQCASTPDGRYHNFNHFSSSHTQKALSIYADSTTWADWSWSVTKNFAATSTVHSGTSSLSVTFTQWGGLSLEKSGGIDLSLYSAISFWISGPTATLLFTLSLDDGTAVGAQKTINVAGNTWTQYTFTMQSLGASGSFSRINFQATTQPASAIFFDDIVLTEQPVVAIAGSVTVDTTAAGTPIDSRLLGTNLPAWLGPGHLSSASFQARAKASGATVYRLPGI